jgi:hypothetical protein
MKMSGKLDKCDFTKIDPEVAQRCGVVLDFNLKEQLYNLEPLKIPISDLKT